MKVSFEISMRDIARAQELMRDLKLDSSDSLEWQASNYFVILGNDEDEDHMEEANNLICDIEEAFDKYGIEYEKENEY